MIDLDVLRSFNNIDVLGEQELSNILKTYAFYNPEIEYCQGMNFVAGFFFLFFRDETHSFKALLGLIQRFDLTKLFNQKLPILKEYFYTTDRIISMYVPDLHAHFKNETISSSLFCSAWFITLFSNSLTH